ncbi:uncharacterized protein MELLADRAFT_85189 [Melampsora larici-populina 98AG31]|uniref:Uncharacterized protein n=1 Tax=Melampsora larici-populina (strain 98AG31 / pathotype 3-4-7) TaxID=747676 RepID=F4RHU7_MELLP|nr:uncharacterized protein MELLADRAFT_85189 [Melampsora larici-populina 98AG31]EGG08072.1 hypothetical protein MELLADRAFT_85189 [Melampsora larici-populina 98AG31]
MLTTQLYYPKLVYERRINPQGFLKVELRQPTGFHCKGPRCRHQPIHSSHYYNPRRQPNKPLIGLRCPLDKESQGAFRTYSRNEYIQDICKLNNLQTCSISSDPSVQSSPSAHILKRTGDHLTKSMAEPKRTRLPCEGIHGISTHTGKSKPGNRKCTWQVCPDCCRPQREATGTQCYTHESAERAKATVVPNTQPFLETVLESAASGSTQATIQATLAESNTQRNEVDQSQLLGPAPPLHPLALSPATMRFYHLNRSQEEEAKRAEEAAEASCDKNISISLWFKADSDPISFMFASKSMKQYAISECEALIMFIKATDPHWNQCLRVYDVKADRWNISLVGTSIPMVTPLREALVCMTTVEDPKLCRGLTDLQERLVPVNRTSIRSTLDLLRTTPTNHQYTPGSISARSSSVVSSVSSQQYSTPEMTPVNIKEVNKRQARNTSLSAYPITKSPLASAMNHASENAIAVPDAQPVINVINPGTGPKFSRNIFNDNEPDSPPTQQTPNFFSSPITDLTGPDKQLANHINQSDYESDRSDSSRRGEETRPSMTGPPPPPQPVDTEPPTFRKKSKAKRRTRKTGLWPPPELPMKRMINWHAKHLSTPGKKQVWNDFFAADHDWNRTAMYRYIRWITIVTEERWDEWFRECKRNHVDTTFASAKLSFGEELADAW